MCSLNARGLGHIASQVALAPGCFQPEALAPLLTLGALLGSASSAASGSADTRETATADAPSARARRAFARRRRGHEGAAARCGPGARRPRLRQAHQRHQRHLQGPDLLHPLQPAKGRDRLPSARGQRLLHARPAHGAAGPSGSGKTTLLDILSGRKTTGSVEGEVRFGGVKPTRAFLQRYTGFVEQFDTLIGSLSVEEMLLYTACLKRPVSEPLSSKQQAVDELLDRLGLQQCRAVKIGDPMQKGISGGQAKRTNIGIALITNPRVLFLDEPTSGLDSYTANEVMSLLRGLADDGTSICATIHSPSAFAFKLFDSVLMLLRGEVVYFGPVGSPAVSYAQAYWPDGKGSKDSESDAELLVGLITDADRQGRAQQLAQVYRDSELKKDNDAALAVVSARAVALLGGSDRGSAGSPASSEHGDAAAARHATTTSASAGAAAAAAASSVARELSVRKSTSTPWWSQLLTLLRFRSAYNYRDPQFLGPRIMDKLIFSLIILTLYLSIGNDFSQGNIVNITSVLFMWCVLPAFGAASYVPSIVMERRLFVRERADGLYSVFSYLLYKLLEEVFLAAFTSLIFSSWVFYAVRFEGSFAIFWIVYYITLCNGIVLAYLVAAISPSMEVANAALPAYVVTLLFFAGQLMTFSNMPKYWEWYSYVDFVRYSWGALMVNQFKDATDIWSNGQTVLQYFSLDGVSLSAYVGYNSLFFLAYGTLAYLALSFIKHQKR